MPAPRRKFICSVCKLESEKTVSNLHTQIKRDGVSILLGSEKESIVKKANDSDDVLDLDRVATPELEKVERTNQYDSFFK